MVGGAATYGWQQVTQEGHVGRAGERGKTWAREGEIIDGLRGRESSDVWHHSGLGHRRTMFVASGFEWFTASHSVAVESCLTRLLKDTPERAKIETDRKRVGAEHLPPRVRRNYATHVST